jgi:N-acetylglucosaminyl-diphospho-decaprenol L-rhamnosyltransferase
MPTPDFSLIITNRNASRYLRDCLQSLLDTKEDVSVEVILVDAVSTDDSLTVARSLWPQVKIVSVPENLGYVRANNVGLKRVTGRYLIYLNTDTVMLPGYLPTLREFLDSTPDAGAISGGILNTDGSDQGVSRNFPSFMNGIFGRRSFLSHLFPNNRWYRHYMKSRRIGGEPVEVEIISAAAMIVRSDLAKQIGGMDEGFRFYWVDSDICGRLRRMGYKIYCVPRARIIHHEGKGGSTDTFRKRWRMTVAFNADAYRAYVKWHGYREFSVGRVLTAIPLCIRTAVQLFRLALIPNRPTSSGGHN